MGEKIESFSGGFWRLEVEIVPSEVESPKMDLADITPFLDESNTEEPLLARVKGVYISITSSNSIPYKVVAVPKDYEEFLGFELPRQEYVLIPKDQDKMKEVLNPEDDDFGWNVSEEDFRGGSIP